MTNVGFEVFTAVVMKSIIFWDMAPCSPLSFNRRFGGTYRFHLQGRRNRFTKTSKQAGGLKLNALHGVISQKMILLMTNMLPAICTHSFNLNFSIRWQQKAVKFSDGTEERYRKLYRINFHIYSHVQATRIIFTKAHTV
jgi:hypothetical protein